MCYDYTTERLIPLNLYICGFVHALLLIAMSVYMIVSIAALYEKEFLLPNINIACVHFLITYNIQKSDTLLRKVIDHSQDMAVKYMVWTKIKTCFRAVQCEVVQNKAKQKNGALINKINE